MQSIDDGISYQGHLQEIFGCFPEEHVVTADAPELQPGRGKPCPDVSMFSPPDACKCLVLTSDHLQ